jgi:hypothetical protein
MDLSASGLFASLLVSTIGFGLYLYGKREHRWPQLAGGIVLMVFPYFTGSATWTYAVGGALMAGLWIAVRAGL